MKNLKSWTSRGKFSGKMWVNMKKHLFWMLASILFVSMLLISCNQPVNNPIVNIPTGKEPSKPVEPDIFALDISQETDWNYMVVGKDGSSMVFSVDESTDIPSLLYLKPEKDSDDGFTYLFKENGLPDKVIHNGHILYFGNFSGYTFDLAIIYPNDTIEYHYGIETDINWDAYNEISESGQGRSIFSVFSKSLSYVSHAIGIGTCVVSTFFPPALLGCASYVVSEVGHGVIDKVFDGYTADLSHTIINVLGCAGGGVSGAIDCVTALGDTANLLTYIDLDFTDQRSPELAQANGVINGGRGDVKVTLSWNNLADVDLHVVDPYGERIYYSHKYSQSGGILDFDNMYGYGPENIYWPTGNAPNGTYIVYVHFYGSGTSGAYNSSSNYTVLINAFGNTKTYTGTVTRDGGYVLVATFNSRGIDDSSFLPSSHTPLTMDQWRNGNLTASVAEQWYSFSVSSGTTYRIWLNDSDNTSGFVDCKVAAYYSNGDEIFDGDYNEESFTATSTGTVYVRIYPYSNGTGPYSIAYSTSSTIPRSISAPITPLKQSFIKESIVDGVKEGKASFGGFTAGTSDTAASKEVFNQ